MSRKLLLFAAAGIAAAAGVYAIGRHRSIAQRRAAEPDYVNSAVCSGCHAEIAKTYARTGMGRRARTERMTEDYQARNELFHSASGRYYTMIARDGKWFEQRHQAGFDGKPANLLEMQIDYVIGSGNHVRTYLHRTAEGKLVELPVSWYSEKNGYWAMSPGYDRRDQSDFRRTISYECFSISGLRSWPVKGFESIRIYYVDAPNCVRVVRILHGKRDVRRL